jgi:hypothetical protein
MRELRALRWRRDGLEDQLQRPEWGPRARAACARPACAGYPVVWVTL